MSFAIRLYCFSLACFAAGAVGLRVGQDPPAYYWLKRGRDLATSSSADYQARSDFSQGPTWVWENELNEQVRHSPMIDDQKNIYVCTTTRLRKFDPAGSLSWTWHAGKGRAISAAPALYNGSIFVLPRFLEDGHPEPVSISMATGKENWKRSLNGYGHGGDAASILVHNDTIIFGASRRQPPDGTDTVMAVSASDGHFKWKFQTETVMWNFAPSMYEDGSLLFSSMCGEVFRISNKGQLMWQSGEQTSRRTCVPAGGALGPNGIFYAEYNLAGGAFSGPNQNNTLAAYKVSDGSLVWKKDLPLRAAQYPAVGKLGEEGPLAVLIPMGDNPTPVMPRSVELGYIKQLGRATRNVVMAVDASTGKELWTSEEEPWENIVGAGERSVHNITDGSMCYPDAQGIPVITKGVVYTSSSHHGDLRAIKVDKKGGIAAVSTFKTENCFLNSPSAAPGLLVAAPCWGPMYVFVD